MTETTRTELRTLYRRLARAIALGDRIGARGLGSRITYILRREGIES